MRNAFLLTAVLWTAPGWAQNGPAEEAAQHIAAARQALNAGNEDAVVETELEQAEPLAEGFPALQVQIGQLYAQASFTNRAAVQFMKAALNEERIDAAALAIVELTKLVENLRLPQGYNELVRAGLYEQAVAAAPWWPAAYWASAVQAQIDGKRDVAFRRLREFEFTMMATGLDKPYRDWTIEASQMRDQVGRTEAQFLVDAKFLPSDWKQRIHGTEAEIAQAFGDVDAELWDVAGEAMRYTLRYKTLRVGPGKTYASIQTAVDALLKGSGGGAIEIEPGEYRESVILKEAARVVLRARRPGTVRVVSDGAALRVLGGSQIVIDGMEFISSGKPAEIAGAHWITVRRSTFRGGAEGALHAKDAFDLYLWGVDANSPETGVWVERTSPFGWVKGRIEGSGNGAGMELDQSQADISFVQVTHERNGVSVWGEAAGCAGKDGCPALTLRDSRISECSANGLVSDGVRIEVQGSRFWSNSGAGVHVRGGWLNFTDGDVAGPGRLGIGVQGHADAQVAQSTVHDLEVGISASEGASLALDDDAVTGGRIDILAEKAAPVIRRTIVNGASAQGILFVEPPAGWSVEDSEIYSSSAAFVVMGGSGPVKPASCDEAGGRAVRTVFADNGVGVVAAPSGHGGGSICLSNDTFADTRQAAVWAVPGGPSVVLDRSILAYNGIGLVDRQGRIKIDNSDVFGSVETNAEPATSGVGLRKEDPQFIDEPEEDWRLAADSPVHGLGAFPD